MTNLIARFRVRSAELEHALSAIRTFVTAIGEHEPDMLRYESYQERGDPTRFMHMMRFLSPDAEALHRGTEHVQTFVKVLYPLCEEAPSFTPIELAGAVGAQGLEVRNVRHAVDLPASPSAVYDALMDPKKHARFTGFSAEISQEVGGVFVTCGGRNSGRNLVLRPGKRIVQSWTHRDWPEDHMSIATFHLEPAGVGTRLMFTQLGVPTSAFGWIDGGWRSTYWQPLARYLAEG